MQGNFIKNLIEKIKLNKLKGLTFYVFWVLLINTFLRDIIFNKDIISFYIVVVKEK